MNDVLPYLSAALGFGVMVAGLLFAGRKVRGEQYKTVISENEAYDRKLAGARRTIDALYAYIHRWRRWVFQHYPDAELPAELVNVPDDESRE